MPLICVAVLCSILTLGLWPFHAPRNDVVWLGTRNGLRFGTYSTVVSSAPFQLMNPLASPEASIEIWLQPKRIWDSGTFLSFYRPEDLQFSLRQSQTDLLLKTRTTRLYVDGVFPKLRPVFITVTSSGRGACIYIDGVLVASAPRFPLSASEFTGRLILGDSPGQTDSWSGQLLGLALYLRQLQARQVLHHYATWKQTGRPEIAEDAGNLALYLFDEHSGRVVRDKARSGVDLYVPERYQVMEKIVLEPFWTEFRMSRNYWRAALKNIVGFIPFGFCFYAYLVTLLPMKRAALVTIALGTTASFTIEILQAFLPTRESGTTDIITNTIGTSIGVASYHLLIPTLARFSPWPLPLPHRKSSRQAVWSATDSAKRSGRPRT